MRFPALALLTLGLAAPAAAQTPLVRVSFAGQPAVRPVARSLFSQAKPDPTKKPKKKDPIFSWKDHPTLTLGIVEIAFRARLQFDHESTDESIELDEDVNRGLDLSRRRVGIAGRVRGYAEFQVEYDLQDDADPWRDVYVAYTQFDEAQFQLGKFKLPFSLDENTSPTNLDFVYRSLAASTLAPGRDIGWMVHGRVVKGIFRYEFGSFEHDGANARPKNSTRVFGGRTEAARISVLPFRLSETEAADLLVGVAWTSSDLLEGYSALRGEMVLGPRFYSSEYYVQGERKRLGFEMRWRPGPFSVKAEYMKVTEERLGQSVEDTDLSPLRARGWYVSGTWAITGEKKADGLDAPKRPLFQGGFGAVEVGARVEELKFDSLATGEPPSTSPRADVILGNGDKVFTFGVNWYVNRWVKVQFNVFKETLADPAQGPAPAKSSFWSRVVRFQFQL